MKKYLIISIHDFTPKLAAKALKIIDTLAASGVDKTSILVVPNYHRSYPLEDFPQELHSLKKLQEKGHEVVLHGYDHQGKKEPWRRPLSAIISRIYTRGEGEFFKLNKEQVERRLKRGKELFDKLALSPAGFVAPAWLYSKGVARQLKQLGFSYYTDRFSLIPLQKDNAKVRAKAIVFSHSKPWRVLLSTIYCRVLAKLQKKQQLVRLAIHPPDIDQPLIWQTIIKLIKSLGQERELITYAELVDNLPQ